MRFEFIFGLNIPLPPHRRQYLGASIDWIFIGEGERKEGMEEGSVGKRVRDNQD